MGAPPEEEDGEKEVLLLLGQAGAEAGGGIVVCDCLSADSQGSRSVRGVEVEEKEGWEMGLGCCWVVNAFEVENEEEGRELEEERSRLEDPEFLICLSILGSVTEQSAVMSTPRSSKVLGVNSFLCLLEARLVFWYRVSVSPWRISAHCL